MKIKSKILGIIAAALLLFGIAGQAMASFTTPSELIRVVYEKNGTYEVATDLGSVSSLTTSSALTSAITYNTNNFSQFGGTDWSNYYVVYYAINNTGANSTSNFWLSGSDAGLNTYGTQGTTIRSATNSIDLKYASLGGNQVTLAQSNASSFVTKMSTFTAFASASKSYQTSLADLATVGYVDQVLYYFDKINVAGNGLAVATIRTFADGHTELLPVSSVPVPAALYLLGSGMVALIGIRRRMVNA